MCTNQIVFNISHKLQIQYFIIIDYSTLRRNHHPLLKLFFTTYCRCCFLLPWQTTAFDFGLYFEFFHWLYIMTWQENPQFAMAEALLRCQKHYSSLCISSCISIDGTVHQADFDSAWFVAMTLPDHFLSHGCCCSPHPPPPTPYPLTNLHSTISVAKIATVVSKIVPSE